jgi:hypothetical protein
MSVPSREFWPLAILGLALGILVRYFTADRSVEQNVLFSLAVFIPFVVRGLLLRARR